MSHRLPGVATATPGSVVRVTGAGAAAATGIIFLGRRGPENDVGHRTLAAVMHLRDRPLVHEHEPVVPGDRLGFVRDTGDAEGCHLHVEAWRAPGWYAGGAPFDPLPALRWDAGRT